MFFAQYSGMDSSFLELKTNGVYQVILRMHAGSVLKDEGVWSETETGDIALHSEMQYCVLDLGDRWRVEMNEKVFQNLPISRNKIQALLVESTNSTWSSDTVETIFAYPHPLYSNRTCSVFWGWGCRITRRSLAHFVERIDQYLQSPEMTETHLRPIAYKSYVVLIDLGSKYFSPAEQVADLRETVDKLVDNQVPRHVYVALTEEHYDDETSTTEPFKFVKPRCSRFK